MRNLPRSKSRKLLEHVQHNFKLPIEVRRLPVGDGIWIARHKHHVVADHSKTQGRHPHSKQKQQQHFQAKNRSSSNHQIEVVEIVREKYKREVPFAKTSMILKHSDGSLRRGDNKSDSREIYSNPVNKE